jgi:hypothetical protein
MQKDEGGMDKQRNKRFLSDAKSLVRMKVEVLILKR